MAEAAAGAAGAGAGGGDRASGGYNPNAAGAGAPAAGAGAGAPAAGAGAAAAFEIPAEYKDKPYLKDVKDLPSVLKMLDGAQTKLGQRPAGIPQDSASDDEWNKFFATVRPEKAEGYEFKRDEAVAKSLGIKPEVEAKVKGIFHEAGLTKRQASIVQSKYEALQLELAKDVIAQNQKQDEEFEKLAETSFGKEADKVLTSGKAIIDKYLPANMKPFLAKLDNNALVVMAGFAKAMKEKFMGQDEIPAGGEGAAAGATTEAEIRKEASALMALPAYSDKFHKDHEATKKKVDELYAKIK